MLYALLALFSLTSVFYAPAPASVQLVCHSSMSALMPWANYTLYKDIEANKLCQPDYRIARWETPDQGDVNELFDLAMVAQRKAKELRANEMKKRLEKELREKKLKEEMEMRELRKLKLKEKIEMREREGREVSEMKRQVYYHYRCIQAVLAGILSLVYCREIFAGLIIFIRYLPTMLRIIFRFIIVMMNILAFIGRVVIAIFTVIDRMATFICDTIVTIYIFLESIAERIQNFNRVIRRELQEIEEFFEILPNPIRGVRRAVENIQDFFEDVQNPVRDVRRAVENYQEILRDLFFWISIIVTIAVVIAISYPLIVFYHSLESELMQFLFHFMVCCALFIFVFIYAMLKT
jgi:methyl-accepting chemotaxis protein